MANSSLFGGSVPGKHIPATNTKNDAGGAAYLRSPEQALAQYATTGCLSNTFYADAKSQLDAVLKLANEVPAEFVARLAIYARQQGKMKDMPALLLAVLATRDVALMSKVFDRVIDSGKMLRNFVQIIRSGAVGRKSLGTAPRNAIRKWLLNASEQKLLDASVGQNPSLADVVKMVHPKPTEEWQRQFFAWLIGKPFDPELLPLTTAMFEAFKKDMTLPPPPVPFRMLTSLPLTDDHWKQIARDAKWHTTRMNLNTFYRHGVLYDLEMIKLVAERLKDAEAVRKAKAFPHELLAAYLNIDGEMAREISLALQDAMEVAVENVPTLPGESILMVDISSSMKDPVTGRQGDRPASKMRRIHVATLMMAAFLRKNPSTRIIGFNTQAYTLRPNPRDSVITIADAVSSQCGGGTTCAIPMLIAVQNKFKADNVIMISDNESWGAMVNNAWNSPFRGNPGMGDLMVAWNAYRHDINPNAKLALIDISPSNNTQAAERSDVLNIGGFSDSVFTVLEAFFKGNMADNLWVDTINAIEL